MADSFGEVDSVRGRAGSRRVGPGPTQTQDTTVPAVVLACPDSPVERQSLYLEGMNLQQLAYFREAVVLESFSAAAKSLHLAQPSLSEQIRRLEGELGVPLFLRV